MSHFPISPFYLYFHFNCNLIYISWSINDRGFLFDVDVPCDKAFANGTVV